MIELIFKTIACSGLFIGFYLLILQREKMFAFNRFYLLATLSLAFAIPFMELGFEQMMSTPEVTGMIPVEIPRDELVSNFASENSSLANVSAEVNNSQSGFNWWILVPGIYLVVTLVLLLRFISNILNLLLMARLNETIKKQGFTIVTLKSGISTFSFFNYLFVSKNEIKSERIQPEIFRHEFAHMKQKHSFDVILIEFLKVFFWFNPFLYMYKKSIQTNHEFLADAEVLNVTEDTVHYQQLLLEKISSKPHTALASSFNYLVTKKRFIMMTKKTSKIKIIALKLFSIPLLVLTMLVFSEKVSAQVEPGKGVSKELFREYKRQVKKATVKVKNADGTKTKKIETANLDTELLSDIYNKMSDEQKLKVTPLPQNKFRTIDFGDLGVSLGDMNVDLGDLGIELGELGVELGDLFSSPEFTDMIAGLQFDSDEIQNYAESPEMQKKIKEIEKQAAEIEMYYDSPEFKKKIAEIEKNAEEIEKYYDSPEFKKKIEEVERKAAEIEKYYNSPEFKRKIEEIEKQAEQLEKDALEVEKKAKNAEKNAA